MPEQTHDELIAEIVSLKSRIQSMTAEILELRQPSQPLPTLSYLFGIPLDHFSAFLNQIYADSAKAAQEVLAENAKLRAGQDGKIMLLTMERDNWRSEGQRAQDRLQGERNYADMLVGRVARLEGGIRHALERGILCSHTRENPCPTRDALGPQKTGS